MAAKKKILTVFGTRPEMIKLAPVIHELERNPARLDCVTVSTAQHTDLLYPFIRLFGIKVDYDLHVMQADQTPTQVCARVLAALEPIFIQEAPDLILVQGDTTTALAGALAGFYRKILVGHVEAGLRSGHARSPFPEEMNRRLITQMAFLHFAATAHNRATLLAEGVAESQIFVTGNPVVDSLKSIMAEGEMPAAVQEVVRKFRQHKLIVLTTHRRESFGKQMTGNLEVLRRFVERYPEVALVFPVHPNPAVRTATQTILAEHPRIVLVDPLPYREFIHLLSHAWLIVSDSGGVQEEAPSLGKPLLVLRENTERPEAIESGVARLVGGAPARLETMLEEVYHDGSWQRRLRDGKNPYGEGDSGRRIAECIVKNLTLADIGQTHIDAHAAAPTT